MLKITVKIPGKNRTLSNRLLRKIIRRTLRTQDIAGGEINLLISGDPQIKRLNRKYLNRNRPTDVLAFSMREGKRLKGERRIVGDVVVSADRARIQAGIYKSSLKRELALYVIHGVLHLTGFRDGSKKMERLQEKIANEFFKK